MISGSDDTQNPISGTQAPWKVAIVDNDPGFLKFMFRKLSQKGYDVMCAGDGITALEMLISDPPHIIFIDLIMPTIDGERLCGIIRKVPHLKNIRLVMVTAAADELSIDLNQFKVDACIAKESYGQTTQRMLEQIDLLKTHFFESPKKAEPPSSECLQEITHEILKKNRSLMTFLENTSDAVLEIHGGRIIYANPSACHLMGHTEEELLSTKLTDHFDPNARGHVEWLILPENNKRSRVGIDSTVELNGKQVFLQKLPVKEPVSSSILLIEDITLGRQIKEAEAREERLQSVNALAQGIARDFSNLLTPIIGYTELTQGILPDDGPARTNLSQVLVAANKARDLINHIRNFGKQARKSDMPLYIQSVLEHLVKEKRKDIKEGFSIECKIQADCGPVLADPVHIRLMLSQLVENGIQAMDHMDSGVLELGLDTYSVSENDPAPVEDMAVDSWIRLWVKDMGRGMDEQTKKGCSIHISPPIPTEGEAAWVCSSSITSFTGYKGRILVSSSLSEGTCMTIYLPAMEDYPETGDTEAVAYEQGKGRILLVDDEEPIVMMLSELIIRLGYSVTGSMDPAEALELVKSKKNRFDLMITDLSMPKINGEELARLIKEVQPDLPIILCTGFSDLITPKRARAAGITKIAMKPVTMAELGRLIREALETGS